MSGRTLRLGAAAVFGVLLALGLGAAAASWSSSDNSNNAVAVAGVLATPTGATATPAGSGAVTVSWTVPGGQLAGAQYKVVRTSGPGSPTTVCPATASPCSDTGLTAGTTYGYDVTSVLGAWTSPAAPASATTRTPTFTVTLSAGPYTAGTPISVATITAKVDGATDTTYTGAKTMTWSGLAPSPAPTSTPPAYPATAISFAGGVATPASTFTTYAAGSNTIVAIDAAATGVTGAANFSVDAAAADRLDLSAQPTAGQNIQATGTGTFAAAVTVEDPYSNTVSTDSRNVTLAIGANPSAGLLSCTATTVSASSGVASFAGCAITKVGTGYTLSASASGPLTPPTNANAFNITPGTATQIVLTGPATVAFGATASLTATISDAQGNPATTGTDSTGTVTFAKAGGAATFTGLGSATAADGVATQTITATGAGAATLTASATLSAGATTSNVLALNVTAPAPTITSPSSSAQVVFGRNETKTFTVTGTNFVSGLTVSLSTTSAFTVVGSPTFVSATSISVTVKAADNNGNASSNLTVTNPDGGTATSSSALRK